MTAWSALAEAAEARNDWAEAKRCWYYAAQALIGNPYELRTEYGRREDIAEEQRRKHEIEDAVPILPKGAPVAVPDGTICGNDK